MTPKEAINVMEKYTDITLSKVVIEAHNMAIEALEKQIPKKPTDQSKVRDNEGYVGLIGKCPCCGEILEEDTVYCDCGQKIDWSE